jgi:hypothetical protein
MRLNGIHVEPGTIIGVHFRTKRMLAVECADELGVDVRYATAEEVSAEKFNHDPRSVVEHRAIPKILTPFGMGRVYKPTPYPRTDGTDPLIGRYSGKPLGILEQSQKKRHQKFIHELHGRKRS